MPRQPPRVSLSPGKSHEEVCRLCLPPLGCREVLPSAETCDVRLVVGETEHEAALQQKDGSLLNKYPGMWDMCRKVPFARMMERMRQLYPDDFAFVPRTWVLPGDAAPTEGRRKLIVKPDGGSQGDGIFVASGWDDARCRLAAHGGGARECTVSHYIGDPLLLGGLKFDLRVYVVVSSLLPLRVHLCREGLARFATQPYADASGRELGAHLTNYSLNVRTAGFEHNDDPDDGANGSKRTLSATLRELEREAAGFDAAAFWGQLEELVAKTCVAMRPLLLHNAARRRGGGFGGGGSGGGEEVERCFQLLGFDVLIDKALRLHLLEVNNNPSLGLDACESIEPPRAEPAAKQARATKSGSAAVPQPAAVAAAAAAAAAAAMVGTDGEPLKPCRCMSMAGWHVHRRCLVDEVTKVQAVGGMLGLILRSDRSRRSCRRRAFEDAYTPVDVGAAEERFGTLEAARRLFESAASARQPVLSTVRTRQLLKAGAQLGSAEADILYMKARQMNGGGAGGLCYSDFIEMCLDVCRRMDAGTALDTSLRALLSRMEPAAGATAVAA